VKGGAKASGATQKSRQSARGKYDRERRERLGAGESSKGGGGFGDQGGGEASFREGGGEGGGIGRDPMRRLKQGKVSLKTAREGVVRRTRRWGQKPCGKGKTDGEKID